VPSSAGGDSAVGNELVERLQRWQEFGAVWQLVARSSGTVTISFCRCDGGEEVERLTSDDPVLLDWLSGRTCSDS
jgi:hypothetical protein